MFPKQNKRSVKMERGYKYLIYICAWMLVLFMPVFSSCNGLEDDLVVSDEVRLTASLSPVLSSAFTKAEEIKSDYDGALDIAVAKVVGNRGDFKAAENTALDANMSAPSSSILGLREIKFDDFQGFPNSVDTLHYLAWYPQGATYSNPAGDAATTVSFEVPDDASTDILYSDVASGTRLSGFNTMTFRHALVKYTVKAYAMESDAMSGITNDVWGDITAVTLKQMHSTCTLTLPAKSEKLPEVSFGGSPKNLVIDDFTITEIPVGFSKAEKLTSFLAPPPSGNILEITVTTIKDGVEVVESVKTSISKDFQIGKHYQIYLRFTTHGIVNAEIVAGDWIDEKDYLHVDTNTGLYYDLSEGHNANSYVVSSAFNYCFDVTVRGNGYTGIAAIPGADPDIYKVGNPVTAEIIWTDLVSSEEENLDEYFKLSPNVVEGRLFFNVVPTSDTDKSLKREGNVVVGVRDAGGKLLWTWHIWLTDRPAEQGYKNGFSVQDRDLGATAYNPTGDEGTINGMYYQWGRPTPLPLDKTVYKPVYDSSTGVWIENKVVTFKDDTSLMPIVERVAYPTTFFKQTATASDQTLTKHLWGWRTETDEYAKSIYDPCPPGYRVPSIKLWRDLVILDENGDGSHDAAVVQVGGNNVASKFKVDVNMIDVYYPMTGYYHESYNDHKSLYQGACMWAATFALGELDNLSDDKPYALGFMLEHDDLKEMQTTPTPSYVAMPVRCVSRMSKAHVTNLSDYQTANSYIVSKKGFYKFKATVRGNGIGQLVSPGSTSTIVLTEQLQSVDIRNQLVKVQPLWWMPAEGSNVEAPDFAMLNNGVPDAEGFVSFDLNTYNAGNLILAGYDAKGEIIWSWHLWFTQEPDMMKSNSFVVMDRNLGATHAPSGITPPTTGSDDLKDTYGLYYQWGRKDPFPAEFAAATPATIYKFNGSGYVASTNSFAKENQQTNKTVENAVKNPMTFHLASSPQEEGGIFNNNNFFSSYPSYSVNDDDNALENQCYSTMLHPDSMNSFWGYSAATGYGVTTTKTMYDPCPPGYIVAHYLVWTNTERDGSSSKNYYSYLDTGWISHDIGGTDGFFTTKHKDLFDPAWYPFAGYLNGKDAALYKRGYMGIIHTSTPAGNGSRSLAYNNNYSGQIVDNSYRGLPSSFAYPVRCQKE